MYRHILVPTDGSKLSLKAAKEAASLARTLKARITAVYVVEPFMPPLLVEGAMIRGPVTDEQYRDATTKIANEALAKVRKAAAAEKVACEVVSTIGAQPWEGILKTAKAKKCDVIVMASHGRGVIAGAILGSETTQVLARSKTPVLVCR
jgi:nucleotide-binding universal stress UspA family protein